MPPQCPPVPPPVLTEGEEGADPLQHGGGLEPAAKGEPEGGEVKGHGRGGGGTGSGGRENWELLVLMGLVPPPTPALPWGGGLGSGWGLCKRLCNAWGSCKGTCSFWGLCKPLCRAGARANGRATSGARANVGAKFGACANTCATLGARASARAALGARANVGATFAACANVCATLGLVQRHGRSLRLAQTPV